MMASADNYAEIHRSLLSSAGHGKTVGSFNPNNDMIIGIIVGYILFFVLELAICTLHFFYPWGIEMKGRIPPESFLYAGVHSFGAMVATGGILTKFWADIPSPSPLEDWYGYNNVCIVFDLIPAKYVMPSFWFASGYFITRYAVEDFKRVFRMKHRYSTAKLYFFLVVNAAVVFICAFFSVCLAVGPDQDMIAHTTPFLMLIISLPLVYISHWMRCDYKTWMHTSMIVLYAVISYVKASLTITALVATHVAGKYALFIDYLWLGGAVCAPFVFCPIYNDDDASSNDAKEAKRAAFHASTATAPLLLPWFFLVVGNIFVTTIVHTFRHIFEFCIRRSPDAKGAKTKCPIGQLYTGDIFGFFGMCFMGFRPLVKNLEKLGPVFTMNIGKPVVCVLNESSVNAMLDEQDPSVVLFESCLVKPAEDKRLFNFYRKGGEAVSVRQMMLRLMPQNENDQHFRLGVESIKEELRSWIVGNSLHDLDIFEGVHKLIIAFSSTMLTGVKLDGELTEYASPIPLMLPEYPSFPPQLCPLYYRMRSSWNSMIKMIHQGSRWEEIKVIAKEVGLDEREACDNILVAVTLNSLGLSNPMVNAFYLLNAEPHWAEELIQDEALLESFAWELLRHNGPELAKKLEKPTKVSCPAGDFEMKAGTILYSYLPLAQRDADCWNEPHKFKADRFLPKSDGTQEPKPTLAMGCPIKHHLNPEVTKNSHHCVFLGLVVPFLKSFIRLLVEDFHWRLDTKTKKLFHKIVNPCIVSIKDGSGISKRSLHANYSMEKLCGSINLSKDMTPNFGILHKVTFAVLECTTKQESTV